MSDQSFLIFSCNKYMIPINGQAVTVSGVFSGYSDLLSGTFKKKLDSKFCNS